MDDLSHFLPRFRYGSVWPLPPGQPAIGLSYQFYKIVPNDVIEIPVGKGAVSQVESGNIEEAKRNYWEAVEELVQRHKVDSISMSGDRVSCYIGRTEVLRMLAETTRRYGVPATAPFEAVIRAMAHVGARSLAIASLWAENQNREIARYFEEANVKVAGVTSGNRTTAEALAMPLEDGLRLVLEHARRTLKEAPQADCLFLSGGIPLKLHAIPILEAEYGKPVFSQLSAQVWEVLVKTKVIAPPQGWGRLLASP